MLNPPIISSLPKLLVSAALLACFTVVITETLGAVEETENEQCSVDLTQPGQMADVLSNVLLRRLKKPESEVATFLNNAQHEYSSGAALLKATAAKFKVGQLELGQGVQQFKHCNCNHASSGIDQPIASAGKATMATRVGPETTASRESEEVSIFALDVTLHVVLHELGHALIREFDLPVLGNEETMADAFATFYLTTHLPDRAVDVLTARTKSLMIEANEVPRAEWTVSGEHNSDARRAYQIAALAVAADREKYKPVAEAAGLTDNNIRSGADYGSEIHRSWRRTLQPLWMSNGLKSGEAIVRYDSDSKFVNQLCSNGLAKDIEAIIKRFDWHSQVTIQFTEGAGGAGWSRSKRTVTIHSEYIRRFVRQGKLANSAPLK